MRSKYFSDIKKEDTTWRTPHDFLGFDTSIFKNTDLDETMPIALDLFCCIGYFERLNRHFKAVDSLYFINYEVLYKVVKFILTSNPEKHQVDQNLLIELLSFLKSSYKYYHIGHTMLKECYTLPIRTMMYLHGFSKNLENDLSYDQDDEYWSWYFGFIAGEIPLKEYLNHVNQLISKLRGVMKKSA